MGTEGVSSEQAIPGSGGQYEGGAADEASESGGWEVGGNFSDDLFEEPIMRQRLTRREPARTPQPMAYPQCHRNCVSSRNRMNHSQRSSRFPATSRGRRHVPSLGTTGLTRGCGGTSCSTQAVQEGSTGACSHHSPWWPPGKKEDCREDPAKIY